MLAILAQFAMIGKRDHVGPRASATVGKVPPSLVGISRESFWGPVCGKQRRVGKLLIQFTANEMAVTITNKATYRTMRIILPLVQKTRRSLRRSIAGFAIPQNMRKCPSIPRTNLCPY
jgi:hypothetical protein